MTSEETEADSKVPGGAPDLPGFIATIDLFLRLERRRKSEPMFAAVLTDDFQGCVQQSGVRVGLMSGTGVS